MSGGGRGGRHAMFRGRCQGVLPMCEQRVAWTMATTQPHEEDLMASLKVKITRGRFSAPRIRDRGRARTGVAIRIALLCALVALGIAGSALAFQALPPGTQVNDDLAAGIDKTIDVASDSPGNADVVGGSLTPGKPAVPWATFRQLTAGADQIFVRSFAGGKWTTRGNGTVGG